MINDESYRKISAFTEKYERDRVIVSPFYMSAKRYGIDLIDLFAHCYVLTNGFTSEAFKKDFRIVPESNYSHLTLRSGIDEFCLFYVNKEKLKQLHTPEFLEKLNDVKQRIENIDTDHFYTPPPLKEEPSSSSGNNNETQQKESTASVACVSQEGDSQGGTKDAARKAKLLLLLVQFVLFAVSFILYVRCRS